MPSPKNIGIFGGSFSPPTTGHLQLAWQILKSCPIDEVWLSPVYSHNHGKSLVDPEHRLKMCQLACNQDSRFKAFDYEIRHTIEGGTYNFLSKLIADPEFHLFKFHYIIGLDVANDFHKWTRYEELRDLVPFLVHTRKGEERKAVWFLKPPHKYLEGEVSQISSSQIRSWIVSDTCGEGEGQTSREYAFNIVKNTPPGVYEYILSNNLYG